MIQELSLQGSQLDDGAPQAEFTFRTYYLQTGSNPESHKLSGQVCVTGQIKYWEEDVRHDLPGKWNQLRVAVIRSISALIYHASYNASLSFRRYCSKALRPAAVKHNNVCGTLPR